MLEFLLYAVPVLAITVTLYVSYLGWKFYLDEIVRGGDAS